MVAGNVLDATRDPKLALEWLGDRDLKQMKSHLLRREDRLRLAAPAVATEQEPKGTYPKADPSRGAKPSLNRAQTKAPQPGAPEVTMSRRLPQSHRSGLNRRPLDYESSALPLSYGG